MVAFVGLPRVHDEVRCCVVWIPCILALASLVELLGEILVVKGLLGGTDTAVALSILALGQDHRDVRLVDDFCLVGVGEGRRGSL